MLRLFCINVSINFDSIDYLLIFQVAFCLSFINKPIAPSVIIKQKHAAIDAHFIHARSLGLFFSANELFILPTYGFKDSGALAVSFATFSNMYRLRPPLRPRRRKGSDTRYNDNTVRISFRFRKWQPRSAPNIVQRSAYPPLPHTPFRWFEGPSPQ